MTPSSASTLHQLGKASSRPCSLLNGGLFVIRPLMPKLKHNEVSRPPHQTAIPHQGCCGCWWYSSGKTKSSFRWVERHSSDKYVKDAKMKGFKSRAAFKLIEIHNKYHLFSPGQTVVDLGFAPGSWSQVAYSETRPGGQILGIDLLPAPPPDGVMAMQGDFLNQQVREQVRQWLHSRLRTPVLPPPPRARRARHGAGACAKKTLDMASDNGGQQQQQQQEEEKDEETRFVPPGQRAVSSPAAIASPPSQRQKPPPLDREDLRRADVILSDMLMNTSGIAFKDHMGSMDLCFSALEFAKQTLRTGGHLVCKFYQGSEDKLLEHRLRTLFEIVHREKPDSSRKSSKEAYFVALRFRDKTHLSVRSIFTEPS